MPPKACFRGHICFFEALLGVDTLRITDVRARFFTFSVCRGLLLYHKCFFGGIWRMIVWTNSSTGTALLYTDVLTRSRMGSVHYADDGACGCAVTVCIKSALDSQTNCF